MTQFQPILYSFRRCPYAIRARMAIIFCGQYESVKLVEIDLKNKTSEFLQLSAKATVPVLQLSEQLVLEESLDIMQWAIEQQPCEAMAVQSFSHELILKNDDEFKIHLDHYKYADRFPQSVQHYQQLASEYPKQLDAILGDSQFLTADSASVVDVALFPFIRQFSFVDKQWFDQQPWPHLQRWLNYWLEHDVFKQAFAWGRVKKSVTHPV